MIRGAAHAALLSLLALVSCEAPSPPPPAPPVATGPLPVTAVARVADSSIDAEQVARIAAAQNIPLTEARDLAIRDALFAAEARARGLDADRDIELAASGLLARVLSQDIVAAAEAMGPVTDAELDEVTARHWTELDRPDAARAVHAVVTLDKSSSADTRTRAAALAEAIRKALAPAVDVAHQSEPQPDPRGPEDAAVAAFRTAAASVPTGDLKVRIEALAPVVADGRTFTPGARYEEPFARAAVALARRGDVSPVIETSFGFHVILLLERIPAHVVPREERRTMVREEVLSGRARAAREQLLGSLRPRASIDRGVDAVLAQVPVDR